MSGQLHSSSALQPQKQTLLSVPFDRRQVGSQRWSGHGDGREKASNPDYSALNGTVSLPVLSLFLTIFLLDL